jgi:hypothetical protein
MSQGTGGVGGSMKSSGKASDAIARRTRARNPMTDTDFDQIDMVAFDNLQDWGDEDGRGSTGAESINSQDVGQHALRCSNATAAAHGTQCTSMSAGRVQGILALPAVAGVGRQKLSFGGSIRRCWRCWQLG